MKVKVRRRGFRLTCDRATLRTIRWSLYTTAMGIAGGDAHGKTQDGQPRIAHDAHAILAMVDEIERAFREADDRVEERERLRQAVIFVREWQRQREYDQQDARRAATLRARRRKRAGARRPAPARKKAAATKKKRGRK